MGIGITKIRQIKIPVTDLAASVQWYRNLRDLEPAFEFYEEGAVRGVVLLETDADLHTSLRERAFCASTPDLAGFDVVALKVDDDQTLPRLMERCRRLAVPHCDIHDRGPYGAALDVPDPDGTVLRFLYEPDTYPRGFSGIEFAPDGTPSPYREPRLPQPTPSTDTRNTPPPGAH